MLAPRPLALSSCLLAAMLSAACSKPETQAPPAPAPEPAAAAMPETPPPAVDGLDEPLPPFDEIAAELIVREGRLEGAAGEVRLYQIPDGEALLRFEGLRLPSAVGIDVRLASDSRPAPTSLGALKARSGNFNYLVEADDAPDGETRVELYDLGADTLVASAVLQ